MPPVRVLWRNGAEVGMTGVDKFIYKIEKGACLFFCVLMIAIVSLEVVFRYCLGTTLMVGIQEIAKWSFVWLVAMASAALVHRKKHIAVEYFVTTFCPAKLQNIIALLTQAFLIFFMVSVIVSGFPFAFDQWWMRATSANIPKTFPYLAVPVSFTFMLIHSLVEIGEVLRKLFNQDSRG